MKRMSLEDINNCISEHNLFIEKYLSDECILSYTDKSGKNIKTLQNFILSNASGVKPNREKFFESIGLSHPYLLNSKVLEIGVADGRNAERIKKYLKPSKMWLIDPWIPQNNRAADRGHGASIHNDAYQKVVKKFGEDSNIVKDFAKNVVEQFEDEFFDCS